MKLILGIVVGILIASWYPQVATHTRSMLNTVFSHAERATDPTLEDHFNKMVDKALD